jgi:hypothetical protein
VPTAGEPSPPATVAPPPPKPSLSPELPGG